MALSEFLFFVAAGFAAQLVDGTLGMAYGVTASSLLLALGIPPAITSATVHAAECFTTGASAVSHHAFGNVHAPLFKRLVLPGIVGAVIGAYILSSFPGDALKPYVAGYLLLMGGVILLKAFREFPPREVTTHIAPLGFVGRAGRCARRRRVGPDRRQHADGAGKRRPPDGWQRERRGVLRHGRRIDHLHPDAGTESLADDCGPRTRGSAGGAFRRVGVFAAAAEAVDGGRRGSW